MGNNFLYIKRNFFLRWIINQNNNIKNKHVLFLLIKFNNNKNYYSKMNSYKFLSFIFYDYLIIVYTYF